MGAGMEGLPEPYTYAWFKELVIGLLGIGGTAFATMKWANRKNTEITTTLIAINNTLADQGKRLIELEEERTLPRPFCHYQKEQILQTAKLEVQRELAVHHESLAELKDTISKHIDLMGAANLNLALVTQSVASIDKTITNDIKPELKNINKRLDRRSHDLACVEPPYARRSSDGE